MYNIRNSAKGIIVSNKKILLIKNKSLNDEWYTFPGGGLNFKENLIQALSREVNEETGIEVEVGKLFAVRDYIGENHEFSNEDSQLHFVEHYFLCKALGEVIVPTTPDNNQVSVQWVKVKDINQINLFPKVMKKLVFDYISKNIHPSNVYLGDIN